MKNSSCLKPILLPLKILTVFGGLPLKISLEEDGTKICFDCLRGLQLVVYFIIFFLIGCCVILYDIFGPLANELVIYFFKFKYNLKYLSKL